MDLDHAQTLPTVSHEQPCHTETRLQGGWLVLVRLTWLAIVASSLLLFAINIPLYVRLLQTVCMPAASCPEWQPTLETASALHHLGFSLSDYAAFNVALTIISALLWIGIGLFMFWRKSNEWIALIFALQAVTQGIIGPTGFLDSLKDSHSIWQFPATCLNILNLILLWLVFALFPNGRFAPRWMRWLLPTYIVIYLIVSVSLIPNLLHSGRLGGLFFFLTTGSIFGGQIYRYLRVSSPTERQQTKWVVFSLAIVLVEQIGLRIPFFFSPALSQPGSLYFISTHTVDVLVLLIVPPSIAIALLRYRLWDIDSIINRTLVYGTLTTSIVGIYVLVVVSLGALLQTSGNLLISLLATGLVAVLFQPLRECLQLAANRLMFGKRDTPYQVISHLGHRLEATIEPDAVLPTIVETVAQALKLPYVTIALQQEGKLVTTASYGTLKESLTRLPLVYQNEQVGELVLAPRAPGESFTHADRDLLDDLARQVGVAAHAVRLTHELRQLTQDLQQARERLVSAREEERRRLRRDLHDGLGPQLSSQTLLLTSAQMLLRQDPDEAEAILRSAIAQSQEAISDIRRLVYALRPPALDDLGLLAAIQEQLTQHRASGIAFSFDAPEHLPPLPAAVEVACYRIVQEALTNVVRHAHAHTCMVRLVCREQLTIEVIDDGLGLPPAYRCGVGLTSMRERAEELGGSWLIESGAHGGTRVQAQIPYR